MAGRSWFYASEGQQQGPYPEIQLRDLIARGTVSPDTLVWTEGMANWQRAAEIPGLTSGTSGPPTVPRAGGIAGSGISAGGLVSVDFSIWALLGRALIYVIGSLLVIPAPWVATSFFRWFVERLRVPGHPNPGFTGQPGDIWYVFVIQGLCSYAGFSDFEFLPILLIPLQAFLSWMTIRWFVANISSDGQPLSFSFTGSPLGYVGWYLLLYVSAITIIGWAWVITAWMRWNCRNVAGTRRTIMFNASGWQVLWRTLVFAFLSVLIIPIPWILGWYARWYVSQFELVERTA